MSHPVAVHFPIVLIVLWPLLDLAGLVLSRPDLCRAALALLGVAVIASLVATVTGDSAFHAAVEAKVDPELLNTHADNANLVPWVLLGVLAARAFLPRKLGKRGHAAAIVLGMSSWWLIYAVGQTGGALVFEHGVGVQRVEDRAPSR
jgi:uncharacterized membrane protein